MNGKILQIAKKSPIPARDGESMAIHQLTHVLNQDFSVKILSMFTQKHSLLNYNKIEEIDGVDYYFQEVNTSVLYFRLLLNFFKSVPYIVERFYDVKFDLKLVELLKENTFDYIQLEGFFLAMYIDTIRKYCDAKIIMRVHNVEHQIWERLSQNEKNIFKRFYYKLFLIPKLISFELNSLKRCDAIVPISSKDEMFYKNKLPNHIYCTIPVGYNYFPKRKIISKTFNVGFLGSLDWLPNIEGLNWFLNNIWILFHAKYSDTVLNIAGRNMSNLLKNKKIDGVITWGEIDSSNEYIANQSIMIVPLLSGGGMRVKIIESMALGKCVITSNIGAEGVNARNEEHLFLVDEPNEWLRVLEEMYNNRNKIDEIGVNAQNFIKENYHLDIIGQKLLNFYSELK